MITAQECRHLFNYNPVTGLLVWKNPTSQKYKRGDVAGSVNSHGYRVVGVKGRKIKVHRIIWAIVTGSWPEFEVDHDDGDRANNAWINLRLATTQENSFNRKCRAESSTGAKGVFPTPSGKYIARITISGKRKSLGHFDTIDAAKTAYDLAAQQNFGSFARS